MEFDTCSDTFGSHEMMESTFGDLLQITTCRKSINLKSLVTSMTVSSMDNPNTIRWTSTLGSMDLGPPVP